MVEFAIRYKKLILIVWCCMVLGLSAAIIHQIAGKSSAIDNSVAVWFMRNDSELIRYERYNDEYGQEEWMLLMVEAGDSIYDSRFLADLRKIVDRIERVKHVKKVNAIVNIRDNEMRKDGMLYYNQIYRAERLSQLLTPEQVSAFRTAIHRNPIFNNNLIRKGDDRHTVILIKNDNFIHNIEPYRIAMVDDIRAIVDQYESVKSYALAGTTVVNAELNRASLRDVYIFYTLISVSLVIFGLAVLRHWKDLLVLLAVVVGTILPTMGLIALCQLPYNMVTVTLPTILIALAVADAIHMIHNFHQKHQSQSAVEALKQTMRKVYKPAFWTSFTTVMGFLSLTTSSVSPIFQLGIFASLGIMLAWASTIFLVPQLLVRLWRHPKFGSQYGTPKRGWIGNIPKIAVKRKKVFVLSLALLAIPCLGMLEIDVDTNYTEFFGRSADISGAYQRISKAGYGQNPVTIAVKIPDGMSYGHKDIFGRLLRFEEGVRRHPEVIKLLCLSDLLKEVDRAFNDEDPGGLRFSGYNQEQISQLMLLAEISGNDDINDFLPKAGNGLQIIALTPYMSSKEMGRFRDYIQQLKRECFSGKVDIAVTGTTVLWANMDRQIARTQLLSIAVISLTLMVLLPVIFGSVRIGLLCVFVNILPLGFVLGIMGLMGIKVNMATAVIGGISIGVVVDDTVHIMMSVRRLYRQGLDWSEAVDRAVTTVGESVIMTSIILIAGFISMATSIFLPTSQLGIFISVSIAIALYLDLFILPVIVKNRFFVPAAMPAVDPDTHKTSQIEIGYDKGGF